MNKVIVSRHPATIRFIAEHMFDGREFCVHEDAGKIVGIAEVIRTEEEPEGRTGDEIPVISGNATPDDIRNKDVWGNIPLSLAVYALSVRAVEFALNPPRGMEYTVEDMRKSKAFLSRYVVQYCDWNEIR